MIPSRYRDYVEPEDPFDGPDPRDLLEEQAQRERDERARLARWADYYEANHIQIPIRPGDPF